MDMDLKNKVVIVTGAASGIGLASSKKLIERGAKVMMADWAEMQELIGTEENVFFMKTDVSKEEDIKRLVSKTVEHFGKVDIIVANAGVGSSHLPHEETLEEWNRVIGINLTGVFLIGKYGAIEMLKQGTGGSIINMASILGEVGNPNGFTYSAAKGGIVNMTRSFALAYAKDNIRVNAIAPGYIDTPILSGMTPEMKTMLEGLHPMGRLGFSEEVADAVCFLASEEASFITGTTLPVDGGYLAQ